MELKLTKTEKYSIVELKERSYQIKSLDDMVDLLGNAFYLGSERIIIYEDQLLAEFFDLKTGVAGSMLQKASNYRMRLAIVGDFTEISSKSLRDFIYESNKSSLINFLGSREEALLKLSS